MSLYKICLVNTEDEFVLTEVEIEVDVLTFAEAARSAYILRSEYGFNWEITSIRKV